MSADAERSLADEPTPDSTSPEPGVPMPVDTSPDVSPEDFDWDDFLAGARPTRRSVKIYQRADLVGPLEELAQRIEATDDEDEADRLEAKFIPLQEQFLASGRWVQVEKRSSEWQNKFRADTAKELGITLDDKGDAKTQADSLSLWFQQCAAQVVVPSRGVTPDSMRRLFDINEGEFNKIFLAVRLANTEMAETVRVVGPDFSPKPSTHQQAQGS